MLFLSNIYIFFLCNVLQVPTEFKEVLDNTVVVALSHSSLLVSFGRAI